MSALELRPKSQAKSLKALATCILTLHCHLAAADSRLRAGRAMRSQRSAADAAAAAGADAPPAPAWRRPGCSWAAHWPPRWDATRSAWAAVADD